MAKQNNINKQRIRPQSEDFSRLLKDISKNISADDKQKFMSRTGYSQPTVSRYLNGKGKDVSMAHKMYMFFKREIDKRAKVLA